MFNEALIEFIKDDFKEILSLDVSVYDKKLEGTLANVLIPYLVHTNTIDHENRIISIYTQPESLQQKPLLPFQFWNGAHRWVNPFSHSLKWSDMI